MVNYDHMDTYEETRQRAEIINPQHTNVTAQPIKTPLEVQLGLTLLPARYILRALSKGANDSTSPKWLHKVTGADFLRDQFSEGLFKKLEVRLKEFEPHVGRRFADGLTPSDEIVPLIRKMEVDGKKIGEELIEDITKLHRNWDAGGHAENTIKHFFRQGEGIITNSSKKRIKGAMSEAIFEMMYDGMLGAGSLIYTRKVQNNVLKDVMNIYSEAVAYETGKDPKRVTEDDITNSDNRIVQSTVANYRRKKLQRYGISALPFLKMALPFPGLRAQQWGEVAVGAWGGLWAYDIWGRQPTMLENFRSFVNDKLNPLYGISDTIKPADVINMYQQYAYSFAPEQAFRSVSMNDEDANMMWAQSEKVFERIATLMNDSYNYKHSTDSNAPLPEADFTLPKFIYLLGHGLINARKPEWSMAFIEIANTYGMDEVRKAEQTFKAGGPLEDVLKDYPVDLNPTQHSNGISRRINLPSFHQEKQTEQPTEKTIIKPEANDNQPEEKKAHDKPTHPPVTTVDSTAIEAAKVKRVNDNHDRASELAS